jgi:hypothetical protein
MSVFCLDNVILLRHKNMMHLTCSRRVYSGHTAHWTFLYATIINLLQYPLHENGVNKFQS